MVENKNMQTKTFNLIRVIAAFQVFWGHANHHLGTNFYNKLLDIFEGVPIFFILSGFLIWGSLDRNADFKKYIKKRILRLYPVLFVGLFLSILSIVILYHKNISWAEFGAYILAQSTFFQFWTPGFLRGYGCGTPNGSLWTIIIFIQFYIGAWFMHKHMKKNTSFVVIILISMAFNLFLPQMRNFIPTIVYKLIRETIFPYLWLFILGSFIWKNKTAVLPFFMKVWWIAGIVLVIITMVGWHEGGLYGVVKSIMQSVMIFGFAYRFPNLHLKKDLSFEFYVFHMIIINIMIELGYVGSLGAVVTVLLITLLISYITNVCLDKFFYHSKKRQFCNAIKMHY